MIVTWKVKKVKSGPLSDKIVANASRRITRLTSNRKFKIGITSDPRRRADEYCYDTGDRYQEMVVLCQTETSNPIRKLEAILVSKHQDSDNKQGGGGGQLAKPPYYLYVVRSRLLTPMEMWITNIMDEIKRIIGRW